MISTMLPSSMVTMMMTTTMATLTGVTMVTKEGVSKVIFDSYSIIQINHVLTAIHIYLN